MAQVRILVVEDESAIADFLQRGLEAEGYTVRCAHDGVEGERRAVTGETDLVVLDVMLPGREVTRAGESVRLSTREFDLLVYFARHPGQVLSREQLLNAVWGYTHDPGTNVAGVYVGYLRRKLAQVGASPALQTVRGAGYKLTPGD